MTVGMIALVAGLLVAVVYGWILKRRLKEESLAVAWLGHTVSIIVGAFIAIFLFAVQHYLADRQAKQRHRDLVTSEIRSNLKDLNNPNRMNFPRGELTIKALVIDLQDIAIRRAIESGLFDSSETEALYIMDNGVAKFRRDREYLLSQMNGNPQNLKWAADAIDKQRQLLIDATGEFVDRLGIPKKDVEPDAAANGASPRR